MYLEHYVAETKVRVALEDIKAAITKLKATHSDFDFVFYQSGVYLKKKEWYMGAYYFKANRIDMSDLDQLIPERLEELFSLEEGND